MAGSTPRFALNFFGGDTPGAIDDDDGKYTSEDRLAIDRLLAALEKHEHHLHPLLETPDDQLTLAYNADDGALEAGTTYSYVVSFVNEDGLESVAGPETSIDLPDLLDPPDAPSGETTTVSGGQLVPGMYYFALTGLRGDEESALGDYFNVTVLDFENAVALDLPDLGEATSYQVWRQGEDDPGFTRIGTTATGTFTDDGSVPAAAYGDPANQAPVINEGASDYSITITLAGDDLTRLATATSWRLYRTDVSGAYSSTSLVHEVVEHDGTDTTPGDLLTSWIDTGDAPLTGSPKLNSTELNIPPFTLELNAVLPDATAYPDGYLTADANGVLYMARNSAWQATSGSRGVALFTGTGDPTGNEPSGAQNGDVFIDTTTGDLYLIDGL